MKFCSIFLKIFFYLNILNKICLSNISTSECSLTIELKNNSITCLPSECFKYLNPKTILERSCQINYLNLSFTNDEIFLDFIENQAQHEFLLEEIFNENNQQTNTIEISIDYISRTNNEDFLSYDMFSYLGGESENIQIFKLNINRWIENNLKNLISIQENLIYDQPFQEISLKFYCNYNLTFVQWILYKQKSLQQKSPCPTQIQIQSEYSNQDIYLHNQSIIIEKHSTQKKNRFSFIIKIIICICLITIGIVFCIYYFVYLPKFTKRHNNYFDNYDLNTSVSEADQNSALGTLMKNLMPNQMKLDETPEEQPQNANTIEVIQETSPRNLIGLMGKTMNQRPNQTQEEPLPNNLIGLMSKTINQNQTQEEPQPTNLIGLMGKTMNQKSNQSQEEPLPSNLIGLMGKTMNQNLNNINEEPAPEYSLDTIHNTGARRSYGQNHLPKRGSSPSIYIERL
ncbi:unnamed protein product [Adineta steineri]|uniref:Transmembrane protein n=1 Tax=Adineta steineri TaxID=433720 RepID=A0A814HRJ2_9BILA|nr:unnamed protein product [Adineta steineri]